MTQKFYFQNPLKRTNRVIVIIFCKIMELICDIIYAVTPISLIWHKNLIIYNNAIEPLKCADRNLLNKTKFTATTKNYLKEQFQLEDFNWVANNRLLKNQWRKEHNLDCGPRPKAGMSRPK